MKTQDLKTIVAKTSPLMSGRQKGTLAHAFKVTRRKREPCKKSVVLCTVDRSEMGTFLCCPICRELLSGPVTIECGHTFCNNCLLHCNAAESDARCLICTDDIRTTNRTNVLIRNIVEKWKEKQYVEGNYWTTKSDIFGVEPRYHLRSGFVGLRINGPNKLNNYLKMHASQLDELLRRGRHNRKWLSKSEVPKFALYSWDVTLSDFDCAVCSRCILEPVTTPCGHTFCRGCLQRVLDHGLACPLCMGTLSAREATRGLNVVLEYAVKMFFPKEYKERVMTSLAEERITNEQMPVFVCTNAFPGVACPLYVYEPRYRLLVRRCLQSSSRSFAMAAKGSIDGKCVLYGTILEIRDSVDLPDGNFILTTIGRRRFKVIDRGEKDGYDTAKIQIIKDTTVAKEHLSDLISFHQKVYQKASKWIMSLTPKILYEIETKLGQMPSVEKNWFNLPDGPSWAWWLMPILPLNSQMQVGFLSATNLAKRLKAIDKLLECMEIRTKSLERNNTLSGCLQTAEVTDSCNDSQRNYNTLNNSD